MIIYIHGFGGSGEGSKAKAFRAYFKEIEEPFIAPSLSYVPELAIKTLEELIESYHGDVKLIGSSLGGYYAIYLAEKYNLKAILLNPSINPHITLSSALGKTPNFYDESAYLWSTQHIKMLKRFKVQRPKPDKWLLLVQKGDALLDYKEAVTYLSKATQIIEQGGNHGFEKIERYFETIRRFFGVGNHFKHTIKPKGIYFNNNTLALRIGDMYYDTMAHLLTTLSKKLSQDAKADASRGRKHLANNLYNASNSIAKSAIYIEKAWKHCETHTLKWLQKHGNNRNEN